MIALHHYSVPHTHTHGPVALYSGEMIVKQTRRPLILICLFLWRAEERAAEAAALRPSPPVPLYRSH